MSADQIGTTAPPARELAEQYWAAMTRTADLVRKLSALADRYDASEEDGDPRAAGRRASAALMRTTAESGRRLLRSLAPPAFPSGEQPPASALEQADRARCRDLRAAGRDVTAEVRDERASTRDRSARAVTGDDDLGFAARFLAACDRDDAAGDRAAALADRRAAQTDRGRGATGHPCDRHREAGAYALLTLLEDRVVVRQAQGVLMARAGMTAGEAFEALLLAATGPMTLDGVADHVLRRAELPGGQESDVT